jgi:hypothetical protein
MTAVVPDELPVVAANLMLLPQVGPEFQKLPIA